MCGIFFCVDILMGNMKYGFLNQLLFILSTPRIARCGFYIRRNFFTSSNAKNLFIYLFALAAAERGSWALGHLSAHTHTHANARRGARDSRKSRGLSQKHTHTHSHSVGMRYKRNSCAKKNYRANNRARIYVQIYYYYYWNIVWRNKMFVVL